MCVMACRDYGTCTCTCKYMYMVTVDSGFESCVLNLPGSSQEMNIDPCALKEVDIALLLDRFQRL